MEDNIIIWFATIVSFLILFLTQLGLFWGIEKIFSIDIPQRWFIATIISGIICYLIFWKAYI